MKIAILLSGLPRKIKDGFEQYWSPIINNYETDVYLHYWEDEEYNEVLKYYNPKKYICEKPFDFGIFKKNIISINDQFARPDSNYNVAGNFYSLPMFWGWQQVYNLVEGNYDYVIRSRYDIGWDYPLDLNHIYPNYINISNQHWANSNILDDNLTICNSNLAKNLYTNIFNNFIDLIRENNIIEFAEKNYTNLIKKKNLENFVYKNNNMNFKLLRDFKVWY
jgi:hypothetical protein